MKISKFPYVVMISLFISVYFFMLLALNYNADKSTILLFQFSVVFFTSWIIFYGYSFIWKSTKKNESHIILNEGIRISNRVIIIFLVIVFVLGIIDIRYNTNLLINTNEMRLQTIISNGNFIKWIVDSTNILSKNFYAIGLLIIILITILDKYSINFDLVNNPSEIPFIKDELEQLKLTVITLEKKIEDLRNENLELKRFEISVIDKFERDKKIYKTCDKCCEAMKVYTKIYESRKSV